MQRTREDELFAYFAAETPPLEEPYAYHYELRSEDEVLYLNRLGLREEAVAEGDFCLLPGFFVPEWSKGAVMYQIYTDRFCNGDPSNDVQTGEYLYLEGNFAKREENWQAPTELLDVYRFYGGDLEGVRQRLDYLQSMGVEVIYFNPLFVSPSNHKYDTQDYDHIDPHLGVIAEDGGELLPETAVSNEEASRYVQRTTSAANLEASDALFARLVQEAHARGIKVILDGVFNHCGSFHKWMNREGFYRKEDGYAPGAYAGESSPYRDYFAFYENGSYESWWNLETLPKLNYEASEALCQEILRIGRKWVSPPFCADGWRLDVAADLGHSSPFNHSFWQRFRAAVKEANPQALILAEHYGDVRPWLGGREWDSVMNYDAFMEPLTWFLTGMEKHSDEYRPDWEGDTFRFWNTMRWNMSRFSYGQLHSAMNELDNHDHSRFLTRTNRTVGRLASRGAAAAGEGVDYGIYRQAVVVQMTWPGAPTLYYGDETGLPGWTDPDSRRTFPWGQEDWDMMEFFRYLIRFHRKHPALINGSLLPVPTETACWPMSASKMTIRSLLL